MFRINTDGSGFMLLHEFQGGDDEGWHPVDDLIISGSRLFGTTRDVDDESDGTIYSILIPEPSSLVLLSIVLCIAVFYRFRQTCNLRHGTALSKNLG